MTAQPSDIIQVKRLDLAVFFTKTHDLLQKRTRTERKALFDAAWEEFSRAINDPATPSDTPQWTEPEKIHALAQELSHVLNRYRCEMEMTLASMIGTLEVVKLSLYGEESKLEDKEQ